MNNHNIICKICSSANTVVLFKKDHFDIMKCNDCKMVFTNLPPGFSLTGIYDNSYFQGGQVYGYGNYAASEKVLRKEFSKTVSLLTKLTGNRPGLQLLELGSAYGFFIDEAQNFFECTGLEVSKDAAAVSLNKGHKVFTDEYDEPTAQKIGKLDIVTMFDVIEHLPDPVSTIRLLDQHLNKEGLIIITTGDIDSLLAKMMGKKWRLMTPPQHTFFFSRHTLSNIFIKLGYKLERVDSPWKSVPLGLALYQVSSRLGLKIKQNQTFSNISVPVNLFDTVRLVARKQ